MKEAFKLLKYLANAEDFYYEGVCLKGFNLTKILIHHK